MCEPLRAAFQQPLQERKQRLLCALERLWHAIHPTQQAPSSGPAGAATVAPLLLHGLVFKNEDEQGGEEGEVQPPPPQQTAAGAGPSAPVVAAATALTRPCQLVDQGLMAACLSEMQHLLYLGLP